MSTTKTFKWIEREREKERQEKEDTACVYYYGWKAKKGREKERGERRGI